MILVYVLSVILTEYPIWSACRIWGPRWWRNEQAVRR